jgi:hypothetical protein
MIAPPMTHLFDAQPERFGWRYWHLDHTGTELISPIHQARVRLGRRFFESDCPHTDSPFALAPDCYCGVYYVPDADEFSRMFVGSKEEPEHDLMAVTFGAAVGEHGPDRVLPDDARRAPRYVVLAIMLAQKSASAGALRERYGVNVTMRGLSRDVMADVEQAVRAEYRNVDLAEFLEAAQREPVMPLGRHICDEKPDEFGWKIWTLGDSGDLGDVYFGGGVPPRGYAGIYCKTRTLPELRRFGRRVFVVEPRLPVQYTTGATICHMLLEMFDTLRPKLVATFGVTAGRSFLGGLADGFAPDFDAVRRTAAYYPLAVCIPEERADVADAVQARYGLQVTPSLTMRSLLDVERAVRTRLESVATLPEAIKRGRLPAASPQQATVGGGVRMHAG